jgi:hypothetical protein
MVSALLILSVVAPSLDGKEIGFLELEKKKWNAVKDIASGAGEWKFVVPTEDGTSVNVDVHYKTANEKYYLSWAFNDQRIEMLMGDRESVVVHHGIKAIAKIDTKKFYELTGIDADERKKGEFEPTVPKDEGTINLAISNFQPMVSMNPVPKWVSTESVIVDKKRMTLVTHRVTKDDGTVRCEVKQWFPEGKWIAERVTTVGVDTAGRKFKGEVSVKVLDLTSRLKPDDIKINTAVLKDYSGSLEDEDAFGMLMLLMGLRGGT